MGSSTLHGNPTLQWNQSLYVKLINSSYTTTRTNLNQQKMTLWHIPPARLCTGGMHYYICCCRNLLKFEFFSWEPGSQFPGGVPTLHVLVKALAPTSRWTVDTSVNRSSPRHGELSAPLWDNQLGCCTKKKKTRSCDQEVSVCLNL